MNLKDIMLDKIKQLQRTNNTVWSYVQEAPKVISSSSQSMGLSEAGGGRAWKLLFNEFLFEKMKKFWKWTVMWLYNNVFSMPPNWTLNTD